MGFPPVEDGRIPGCLSAISAAPRTFLDRAAWRSSGRKSDDLRRIDTRKEPIPRKLEDVPCDAEIGG